MIAINIQEKPLTKNDCNQCGEPLEVDHVKIQLTFPYGYQNINRFHNLCWIKNHEKLISDFELCKIKFEDISQKNYNI